VQLQLILQSRPGKCQQCINVAAVGMLLQLQPAAKLLSWRVHYLYLRRTWLHIYRRAYAAVSMLQELRAGTSSCQYSARAASAHCHLRLGRPLLHTVGTSSCQHAPGAASRHEQLSVFCKSCERALPPSAGETVVEN
jgi:hypothetical protein